MQTSCNGKNDSRTYLKFIKGLDNKYTIYTVAIAMKY